MKDESLAVNVSPERRDRSDHHIEPQTDRLSEHMQRICDVLLDNSFLHVVLSQAIPSLVSEDVDQLRTISCDASAYAYRL